MGSVADSRRKSYCGCVSFSNTVVIYSYREPGSRGEYSRAHVSASSVSPEEATAGKRRERERGRNSRDIRKLRGTPTGQPTRSKGRDTSHIGFSRSNAGRVTVCVRLAWIAVRNGIEGNFIPPLISQSGLCTRNEDFSGQLFAERKRVRMKMDKQNRQG